MKNKSNTIANALAVTTGIIYIACRLLVSLFPGLMFSIAQSWLHGIELTRLDSWNISMGTFVVGLASSMVTAWIIGYVFVTIYHYFNNR